MEITLRQLQLLELEIAKEIKRICDKYSIRYYLEGGSLLGAVRHHGFIPWDDDMDIGMELTEYMRFAEIAPNEIDKRFSVVNWDKDLHYPHPYMKVCLNNTAAVEENAYRVSPSPQIWVDVFPYIGISINSTRKRWIYLGKILRKLMMSVCGYRVSNNTVISSVMNIISRVIGRGRIKKYYEGYLRTIQDLESDTISALDDIVTGEWKIKKKYLENPIEMEFEGCRFMCPGGYKDILVEYYGDFMKLPPVSEREKGHSLIKCEIYEPFENYFTANK